MYTQFSPYILTNGGRNFSSCSVFSTLQKWLGSINQILLVEANLVFMNFRTF